MTVQLQTLNLPEHGIFILVRKSGKCSAEDLAGAVAMKTKLQKEGQELRLDKVLLKMGLVTPALIGEILPQVKKQLGKVKECQHCMKQTFSELKVCVFCRKDICDHKLKLEPLDPYQENKKTVGCANCGAQEWNVPRYCNTCGADFGTGEPGPDSYCCKNCRHILMADEAICPSCGTWAPKRQQRAEEGEEPGFLATHGGKVALLLALLGIVFCLREPIGVLLGKAGKEKAAASTAPKRAEVAASVASGEAWNEAMNLVKGGRHTEALASLDKLGSSAEVNRLKAHCHLQLAREATGKGDRQSAREHLREGMKLNPGLMLALKSKAETKR